jgi:hypothetical protein
MAAPTGGPYTLYPNGFVARASDGSITINNPSGDPPTFGVLGLVDMDVQVVPDPSKVPALSAPGLLGWAKCGDTPTSFKAWQ